MVSLSSYPPIYLKTGSCPVCITAGRTPEKTPLAAVKLVVFYAVRVH